MQKNLVIVESPAKAKTIEKFLGADYKVLSISGHIRDLKKKEFSIDTTNFAPQYEIPSEKTKLVNELKAEAKNAGTVWLRREDALASGAEEGRGKLRKATGIGKHDVIRRYPNGAIHMESSPCIIY